MKTPRFSYYKICLVLIWVCLIAALLSSGTIFIDQNRAFSLVWLGEARADNTIHRPDAPVYYVRPEASGTQDGSSWTNAWPTIPDELVRGATYYLADGEYPDYVFDDAEDGEQQIIIKKATSEEHGDATDWDEDYGDGQVIFHELKIETSNWVIDGSRRTSKDSGYGIKIVIPGDKGGTVQEHGITVNDSSSQPRINNITIKYVEFTSAIGEYPEGWLDDRGWERWATKNGYEHTNGGDNVYIGYCYFHHLIGPMQRTRWMNGLVAEHNYYRDNKSYHGGPHGDAMQVGGGSDGYPTKPSTNTVIRYNEFADIEGTAFINLFWGVANNHIYGNVFYFNPGALQGGVSPAAIYAYDLDVGSMYVYNNTFANGTANGKMGIGIGGDANLIGTERYAYNNIWFNCAAPNAVGIDFEHEEYNYFSSSSLRWDYEPDPTDQITETDPFINSTANNFHLQTDLPGKDLSQESWWDENYDSILDGDSNTRGTDGLWDIGAYEFAPALMLHGTPGNQSIHLTWDVNTTLPTSTTWTITYEGTPGEPQSPITGIPETKRDYTLTNLQNHELYTITLSTFGITPILSDTINAIPTNRLIYLPLVRR